MFYIINLFSTDRHIATYRLPCTRQEAETFARAAAEQLGATEIDIIPAIG